MIDEKRIALFTKTVHNKEKSLYRVAFTMLRRSADAEDAVAEGIESAFRHLNNIREDSAVSAYLMRCTINACNNTLRRRKREYAVEDCEIYSPSVHPEVPVWAYLMGLNEKYRLPIAMRYGEDMSIAEISKVLRLPMGTVSTRISRGLKQLRDQMERKV